MGGTFKRSIIVSILASFFASWLGIADRSLVHDKLALDDSMIEDMDHNSKFQEDLVQERVLGRRDLQDFTVEDVQGNVNYSATTLNPLGTRRHWFYSFLAAAYTFYLRRQLLVGQPENWPVASLKLAHPIDDLHGPLYKNFERAVHVFKAVMDLRPAKNATLELSTDQVNTILSSDGSMWGIPVPEGQEILIMNGNGRVAGLKWACLSECFREEERLTVKVQVDAFRSEDPDVNLLLKQLINGLYTCSDLSKQSKQLDAYWQTGAGCRAGPAFGACANGRDVVSSDAKTRQAWGGAKPCMQHFSRLVDNRMRGAQPGVTAPDCDWPGLMRFLKQDEYKELVDMYSWWVEDGRAVYPIDCVGLHARECASAGMSLEEEEEVDVGCLNGTKGCQVM